jgi:hypothetical protein
MDRRALRLIGIACAFSASCALFTPLDEIKEGAPKSCSGDNCTDAGRYNADAATRVRETPPKPMQSADANDDAGPVDHAQETCARAPGAQCNPVTRCGCGPELECRLDELTLSVRCMSRGQGAKQAGQPCADTQDCASGLACTRDRICARYCESTADCENGKCVAYTGATGKEVAGASLCSRWCDPVSGQDCQTGTSCYATSQDDPDPHAACRALRTMDLKARGEACRVYNECESGLSCAEFGPRVCTSFCIFNSDCPPQMPHCYTDFIVPQVAAPGMRAGQCVLERCDDSTIPAPEAWDQGPVWTAMQLVTCGNKCGPSRDCFRNSCTGGEIWGRCMDTALSFCGGAKGAACRKEYVALSCSDVRGREMPAQAFEDCLERQTECFSQAEKICASAQ